MRCQDVAPVLVLCAILVWLCLRAALALGRFLISCLPTQERPYCTQCQNTGHAYDATGQVYLGPCDCGRGL